MKKFRYLKSVATLELDREKCNGCRLCINVCPHEVFEIKDKKANIIDRDACMECGACAMNCQPGAISVKSGVGCASGIIKGLLSGTEPTCDCSGDSGCC